MLFGRRGRRRVFIEQPRLGLGQVLFDQAPDDHALPPAQGTGNLDDVAGMDVLVRGGRPAVDVDLAPFERALGLGPRLEEADDVEPDIDPEGVERAVVSEPVMEPEKTCLLSADAGAAVRSSAEQAANMPVAPKATWRVR